MTKQKIKEGGRDSHTSISEKVNRKMPELSEKNCSTRNKDSCEHLTHLGYSLGRRALRKKDKVGRVLVIQGPQALCKKAKIWPHITMTGAQYVQWSQQLVGQSL